MADSLTKALPRPALERQRDHNMGVIPIEYEVHSKLFRDNADKFKQKETLSEGYFVHFSLLLRHKF